MYDDVFYPQPRRYRNVVFNRTNSAEKYTLLSIHTYRSFESFAPRKGKVLHQTKNYPKSAKQLFFFAKVTMKHMVSQI